ncbi:MAG TPA: acetyl/propionyl/methylcrotonyl-CoA carboxylase subunit alpha [Gammaproteobacteria bacterium]|nr:acetyl/propionyl/methylcrotonyl-CoA carboxylase subunit alpha [Gammaproteobacteria bacterium]
MFDKILIANRGEIACRIARTCRQLGIRTVAVYSEADADAMHVAACDEAWLLGPAPARDSYLNIERILDVARRSGAKAIHPGYGFLSENAEFAEACERAGIVFIGPPASAIRAMGSKSAAKAIMADAGVPLVPGYHGDDQSPELLAAAASDIGYPVLIKASAGGGGKGMRRVDAPGQFVEALAAAKREAAAAFGDDHVLIEKYLLQPRHVEFQIFADRYGSAVHLFERDCSVQRRHQKVIEEGPAPGLSPQTREAMGEAAVTAARAIGYVGAGTVEFIMDAKGGFYFMEMNTRLQVEHPITEMITGQDLVAWRLEVAAGQPLPAVQQDLTVRGHAFEARIYAEDPERDFLPAIGTIQTLRTPAESRYVRIDTGVRSGDEISVHYDPMIAKLIVWGPDRTQALLRLRQALAECLVIGTATNIGFLGRIAGHPAFAAGGVDTHFIDTYRNELLPEPQPASDQVLAAAALYELLQIRQQTAGQAQASADPWSPWHDTVGFRLNSDNWHVLQFRDGERDLSVVAHFRPHGYRLELPNGELEAHAQLRDDGQLRLSLGAAQQDVYVRRHGDQLTVVLDGQRHQLQVVDPSTTIAEDSPGAGGLLAPMPGLVRAVLVEAGQQVSEGDALMVLEAMKMEYTIRATIDGLVEQIEFSVGDQVEEGAELLVVSPLPA